MVNILIHQQMNIISFFVLLMFSIFAFSARDKRAEINRVYLSLICINLAILVFETAFLATYKTDANPLLPRIFGFLCSTLSPLLSYMFIKFSCLYFPKVYKLKRSAKTIFNLIMIINVITALFVFRAGNVDPENLSTVLVPFVVTIVYLLYSFYVILKNRNLLVGFEYAFIISIVLVFNLLVLIQLFVHETRFIFVGSSFVLVLMFIVIQQKELYRDALTGARNRLALKKCLSSLARKQGKKVSIIMMDLDYFKNINDTYGHAEGDYVLKIFVRILQKIYSPNGIVIRMGGDEFLVLVYGANNEELNDMNNRMSKLVDKYNNKSLKPYRIKFSCASGIFDNTKMSIDQFIHEIDLRMYQNKRHKRAINKSGDQKIFNI